MTQKEHIKESRMIFASSCIEAVAKKLNISSSETYIRMKKVGLVENFIFKCYDALHSQSREHVTEDVLGALQLWESKMGIKG